MPRSTSLIATALMLALISIPSAAGAAEANDALPGTPLQLGQQVTLDSATDTDDVFSVWLNQGDTIYANLVSPAGTGSFEPLLLLLPPGAPSLWMDDVARSTQSGFPKTFVYTAPVAGTYFVVAHLSSFDTGQGSCVLDWNVASPVYRFYNARNNTHFYTPSADEMSMVIARWSDVFTYEGIVYYTQPYRNNQPLYRFYNRRSGSHFYTASLEERNIVIARWSNVFTDEGTTYRVSTTGPSNAAVYRFYNKVNGSHFFTASAEERDIVRARWSATYTYEGSVFYLNP